MIAVLKMLMLLDNMLILPVLMLILFFSDEDEPKVDLGNITNSYTVPTTPNIRIHKDHQIDNAIGDVKSSIQVEAMQEELLQFKLQQVWKLVDLPNRKREKQIKYLMLNASPLKYCLREATYVNMQSSMDGRT
ncbi:hypothetical protein Tco_0029736, partial [Tanacetum coccineum]